MKIKLFTRKDKRTKLEKEIDSALDVMSGMKGKLSNGELTDLDLEISSVLDAMADTDPKSDEYQNMVKNLKVLYEAKATTKTLSEQYSDMTQSLERLCKTREAAKKPKISKETILIVSASILELLSCYTMKKRM
jgi:hypothetical protein